MSNNKPILYNLNPSPPVRTVKIVAKLIGLELEVKDIDFFKGEHLQDWYLKLNPEHTVPTLVDNGFSIWDSHAIVAYLVDKYAKDDKLYPKDLKKRARCNQRLFFECSLFARLRDCSIHVIYRGGTEIPKETIDKIFDALAILEAFLATDLFLVGDSVTIADISLACTVTSISIYAAATPDKHPKILAWLERIKQAVPIFDEMNTKYVEEYHQMIRSSIAKNKLKR